MHSTVFNLCSDAIYPGTVAWPKMSKTTSKMTKQNKNKCKGRQKISSFQKLTSVTKATYKNTSTVLTKVSLITHLLYFSTMHGFYALEYLLSHDWKQKIG